MVDISERNFEDTIVAWLTGTEPGTRTAEGLGEYQAGAPEAAPPGGYRQRTSQHYDRELCLDPGIVIDFLRATQPKEWEKLLRQYGDETRDRVLKRIAREVERRGTLDVLRNGVRDSGAHLRLAFFRPSSGLNEEARQLYEANVFSVVRQLVYDAHGHALDLVLFLNGLPLFTAELKNRLNAQDVRDAVRQYRYERDFKEPLFQFARCLAHFAVDPELVEVATHLRGADTQFLPFNQGRNGGAGNPPRATKFATAYLWEEVWAPDSMLNLVDRFIQVVEEEDDKGRKTGERSLIFPRYHQLETVRRLVEHARAHGAGQRYLIQHSAGSGKSNTISWLAHQLSTLHDDQDERVFDSIVVLTDRRVLDRQLRRTVQQFEQTLGLVEAIDERKTSADLRAALESGRTIITTTIQKFPVIADQIEELPGRRFAVIVDEAHSSQSGETRQAVHQVLGKSEEEQLAHAEQEEGGELEPEDPVERQARLRRQPPNMSTFAFTATPKARTLELFGTRQSDGTFVPFSLYSMRQAIDEHFILDVLQNYMTYATYYHLRKSIEDDPEFPKAKAARLIRQYVDEHPHTIASKVGIIVEHFAEHVMHRINRRAKAMIVTRSRLHAVRYKQAVDRYLTEHDLNFKALVAFSGTVRDGGIEYTESNMNGSPESRTAQTFERDEYRLLIVAEKFQYGFDQPLLHTMYVDKKLGGVGAVQTLSRLNRIHPEKRDTMVLDFANEAEEIGDAFQPYYDRTVLTEPTDPNQLYDLQRTLLAAEVFDRGEVERFAEAYFTEGAPQAALYAILDEPVQRYGQLHEDAQTTFRSDLNSYVRLYAFVSQIADFTDTDLEKLYVFARMLFRLLPARREELPLQVRENIELDRQRIERTFEGAIRLEPGTGELEPQRAGEGEAREDELDPLSAIITALNERFGTEFGESDRVFVEQLQQRLSRDEGLAQSVRINDEENARLTFDQVADENLQEMIDANFGFYRAVTDNADLRRRFFDLLFDVYRRDVA